ncbi:MAG TPA: hypothetical protein VHN14_12735 [Kofleriaceae bacterium]|jgi:hypothetical protein|nr:hypothetical protein [Kofleriaceae bacterium]
MRFIPLLVILTAFTAACLGEVGGSRKPGARDPRGSDTTAGVACARVEKDVTIRTVADMAALPRTGCYDLYGKLTVQGSAITSLAALNGINSVNELDLDHTSLPTIDSKRPIGIYGKLWVTGNPKLTNLRQLSFETAATGILIDGNAQLATLDPLGLDDPKLEEVDGDLAITGNAALVSVPLANLTKITGALTISGNSTVKLVDLEKLATTGHVELADNPQLTSLTGLVATTIDGDLAIRGNTRLTTLGTMSSLYRVTGNLTIDGNAALANLAAFTTSLKFVDRSLTITNNQNLSDLGALKHLQLVGAITITNNQNLVTCRAIEIDRCVQHPTTAVIGNNRDINCNWQCGDP